MNPWTTLSPKYRPVGVSDLAGNPLVECLDSLPNTKKEAVQRIAQFPKFDPKERDLPTPVRIFLPTRLTRFVFPSDLHVSVLNHLYVQIMSGYSQRNPLTALGQNRLYASDLLADLIPVVDDRIGQISTISMIYGLSGMGKSTLIRSCMRAIGKSVIRHSTYQGLPFPETQILYLMRNVPDQCTTKAFCKSYGDYVDALLGKPLYAKSFADKSMTRTHYLGELQKLVTNHHVGAMVIDCAEHLALGDSRARKALIAMLVNMRDQLGVPIILVGTYALLQLLEGSMSSARRLIEGGVHEVKRPEYPDSRDVVALHKMIWSCQYVRRPSDYSDAIRDALFDCTQNVTGILISLCVACQIEAIESGKERVDADLIRNVYKKRFMPLHKIVDAIRTRDPEIMNNWEDLYPKLTAASHGDSLLGAIHEHTLALEREQERSVGIVPAVASSRSFTPRKPRKRRAKDITSLHDAVVNDSTDVAAALT